MTGGYLPPALLSSDHELERFECRSVEQTLWLRRHARQSAATGATKVLAVTPARSTEVVAYSAWCMANLQSRHDVSVVMSERGDLIEEEVPVAATADP